MEKNVNVVIEYWSNLIANMVFTHAPIEELKTAILYSAYDIQDRELSEKAHELCRKYDKVPISTEEVRTNILNWPE